MRRFIQPSRVRLLSAALGYSKLGWRVFPLRGKVPMTAHGFHDASKDEVTIRGWHWGTATGIGWAIPERAFVLDVDDRHGGFQALAELQRAHGKLPTTLEAVTGGGGLHLVFELPAGIQAKQSAGAIAAGIDVRTNRGYVAVAPSMHASGLRYRWQSCAPIAVAPGWLVDVVKVRPAPTATPLTALEQREISDRYAAAVLEGEGAELGAMPEGGRNHRLYRAWKRCATDLAGSLDREVARRELTRAALKAGLSEPEIARTLR